MIKSRCFLTLSEVSGSRENETGSAAVERKREKKRETKGRGERAAGGRRPNLRQTERKREIEERRREEGDSKRESHTCRERKGERRREPRVCRGAVCDEPEGPVRDHPNSQDPLFSGARSVYAEVAESGGAGGGAEQTVVGQERVRRRGRVPTPLEILNCR